MLTWESFGTEDIRKAFTAEGAQVSVLAASQEELLSNALSERLLPVIGSDRPDAVFTFNFYPEAAKICHDLGILYLSWTYDSPYIHLFSYTVAFPTNRAYVFDSDTYRFFAGQGIETVRFLPMAADPDRLKQAIRAVSSPTEAGGGQDFLSNEPGITFIGSLYTEKHDFFRRMKGLQPYTEGYLRGLMEAQKHLYGYNIVEESLIPEVLKDLHDALPLEPDPSTVATQSWLFAEYAINRRITAEERCDYLQTLADAGHRVDLFTPEQAGAPKGCHVHPPVDFYEAAPRIYHSSKINLNIALRSIVNGIPLRCFEIMGSGGFLLTSYQGDLELFFTEGRDYVSYSSREELLDKAAYYLKHEAERASIAENGLARIREAHTYRHRVREMLSDL